MSSSVTTFYYCANIFPRKNPQCLDMWMFQWYIFPNIQQNTTTISIPVKIESNAVSIYQEFTNGKAFIKFCFWYIQISVLPLTCRTRKSNLFLIELIFNWPTIILIIFFMWSDFRSVLRVWSTILVASQHLKLSETRLHPELSPQSSSRPKSPCWCVNLATWAGNFRWFVPLFLPLYYVNKLCHSFLMSSSLNFPSTNWINNFSYRAFCKLQSR